MWPAVAAAKMRPMSTPPFVPTPPVQRPTSRADFPDVPPARRWRPRPGAVQLQPRAPGLGRPCPDAGYALLLAHRGEETLVLEPGERRADAWWAVATLAMGHSGYLGRAPCMPDVNLARTLLGYDGRAPAEFARWRARELLGIARELKLRQRLVGVSTIAALPDPGDADAVHRWRLALPTRMGETDGFW